MMPLQPGKIARTLGVQLRWEANAFCEVNAVLLRCGRNSRSGADLRFMPAGSNSSHLASAHIRGPHPTYLLILTCKSLGLHYRPHLRRSRATPLNAVLQAGPVPLAVLEESYSNGRTFLDFG